MYMKVMSAEVNLRLWLDLPHTALFWSELHLWLINVCGVSCILSLLFYEGRDRWGKESGYGKCVYRHLIVLSSFTFLLFFCDKYYNTIITSWLIHTIQWHVLIVNRPTDLTIHHVWQAIQARLIFRCSHYWWIGWSGYHPIPYRLAESYRWGLFSMLNWLAKSCNRSTYSKASWSRE